MNKQFLFNTLKKHNENTILKIYQEHSEINLLCQHLCDWVQPLCETWITEAFAICSKIGTFTITTKDSQNRCRFETKVSKEEFYKKGKRYCLSWQLSFHEILLAQEPLCYYESDTRLWLCHPKGQLILDALFKKEREDNLRKLSKRSGISYAEVNPCFSEEVFYHFLALLFEQYPETLLFLAPK